MNYFNYIYEPEEDSFMLLDHGVEQLEKVIKQQKPTQTKSKKTKDFKICEVGIGSGYVLRNLALKYTKDIRNTNLAYFGTDINPKAIEYTKKMAKEDNLELNLKQKSLLNGFTCKFDLILFNTPYLPCEKGENYDELTFKDKAIYGGKKGYEVIEEFIYQINDKLEEGGQVLMLFSSFSNLKYIREILTQNLFKHTILEEKRVFHEKLYCMKIIKSNILKQINKTNIIQIKYLTKGKHSVIFRGKFEFKNKTNNTIKLKKVIIKYGKEKDIQIEKLFLEKFQSYSFAPKLYLNKTQSKTFVVMEKLEGKTIKQFLQEETNKSNITKVLNKCLEITYQLDKLKINKQELTNPYKHIFIDNKLLVKFIDFERCLYTNKPKNTTQFLDYIRKQIPLFKTKSIMIDKNKIMQISKQYRLGDSKGIKRVQIGDLI